MGRVFLESLFCFFLLIMRFFATLFPLVLSFPCVKAAAAGFSGSFPNFFGDEEEDDVLANNNYGSSNGQKAFPQSAVVSRPPLVVPSLATPSATLFFFHGMGDQGDGWAQTFRSEYQQPLLMHMRFVCPNAKASEDGMTGWFEYQGLDPSAPEDLEGLNAVRNYAHRMGQSRSTTALGVCLFPFTELIRSEISAGIPPNRIFLGGFSQGGPVALYSGLSFPEELGGIICLSGFLLPRDMMPVGQLRRRIPWLNEANMRTPVFIGHGREDPNVPFTAAEMTFGALRAFNPNVEFHAYDQMGHSTCAAETQHVIHFLRRNTASPF